MGEHEMRLRKKQHRTAKSYYLLNEESPFRVREAYNTIRTNLVFMLSQSPGCKIAAFSSCVPAEGKSSVVSNLAVSLASTGKRVLVIDADMRKPVQHKIFRLSVAPGLSDVLADFAQTRCVHKTSVPNLFLLPAGTAAPNPSNLLMSPNFEELLKTLSSSFDYILIDTPPVGLVTDASLVARKTMGIALVTRYNYTILSQVQSVKDMLIENGCNVLGIVVTCTEPAGKSYGRYSRYGYSYDYGYGYGYGYERTSSHSSDPDGAASASSPSDDDGLD